MKRLYWVWAAMIQRCHNQRNKSYITYGAKGIKVCDRWRVFINFYDDMGLPPKEHEIDRIDNNKGYFKDNCRWVTMHENLLNKGIYKTNKLGIKGIEERKDRKGLFRVRVRRFKNIVLDKTTNCFFEACCIYKSFIAKESKK